jgi:two-component system, OmpR family, phosphate regulon sensor histidine kinase PhoR
MAKKITEGLILNTKKYVFLYALPVAGISLFLLVFIGGFNIAKLFISLSGVVALGWFSWCWIYQYRKDALEIKRLAQTDAQFDKKIKESMKQVKEFKLQLQLSQRQRQNIEAVIYSISDAVIVADGHDRLLMANEPASRIFDFDIKESTLKPMAQLIQKSRLVDLISQSRKSKTRHVKHELQIKCDDEMMTYDCIISCIFDGNEKICGTVSILHDITREKEISQIKNDFISHVSHELKTPLASIMAYTEMLADGEVEDKKTREEFYSIIQNQAQRLNRLIEDILNISRIESGLIKVSKEPVSLVLLIRQAVQAIKSYAAEKDITIGNQTEVVIGQVYADKDMISQVIINLLSNAVKYTSNGGSITVESEVDESQQVARVTITDTGVGIPAEDVEHVFDKFFRVKANNKCAKGTGLGLNLVKEIVESVHQGRVFVSSQRDKGSTFGFELPLAIAQPALAE